MASANKHRVDTQQREHPKGHAPPRCHVPHALSGPLLTVIIPVYNERETIDELLERVTSAEPASKQTIVVDDGSTDGTREILEPWRRRPTVEVYFHSGNRGKGAAIRTGLAHAAGAYTLIQDADLEYDPHDYPRLLAPLLDGKCKVVFGSRYLGRVKGEPETTMRDRSVLHPFRMAVTILNVLVRILYGARLTDEATCYKVFCTSVLKSFELECERFEFCPEVTAKACRLGLEIVEVPIRYAPRSKREGKKIGLADAFEAAGTLMKYRRWRGRDSDAAHRPTRRELKHDASTPECRESRELTALGGHETD